MTDLQRFGYAESGGLQMWARVVRLCGHSLVHLSLDERTKLLRTAHKIHITVIPPDENGKPRRWVRLRERGGTPAYKARSREGRGLVGHVRSELHKWHSGVTSHSLVVDSLQSVSHQLASNKSIPLMIFNHTVTGCPTATSTFPFSSNQRQDSNRCGGNALDKYNRMPLQIYLYFSPEVLQFFCDSKAQIATKIS